MAKLITIPKKAFTDDLVVVPRKEYERLQKLEAELSDTLAAVERGRKALREGRVREVRSVRDLME
jgi:hypothetical protein